MTVHEPPFERGSGAMSRGLRTLVRFWWLALPLGILGAGSGAWLASVAPTTYTAEVRLVVGGQSLEAQTVPGFVFAAQGLAATYARYVDEASATGQLEQRVGVDTAESVTSITASPIPESSIIVIEVQGVVAEDVRLSAQALADALVQQVTSASSEDKLAAVLVTYEQLSTEVAQKEVSLQALQEQLGALTAVPLPTPPQVSETDAVRATIATTSSELAVLELRQKAAGEDYTDLSGENNASLAVIRAAEVVADDAITRFIVWGALGGTVGVVLVFVVVFPVPRRTASAHAGRGDRDEQDPDDDHETLPPRWARTDVDLGRRLAGPTGLPAYAADAADGTRDPSPAPALRPPQ